MSWFAVSEEGSAERRPTNNGRDPELKKFAAETLPTLQSHLQMVTGQGDRSHIGTDR